MSDALPAVRLVVLNFNGGDFVTRCLSCLVELDYPRDQLEIVVVDNASSDGSVDTIEREFDVRVIRRDTNDGFPANNDALVDLDGIDYVGLVNPDAFVEPGWLRPLVDALDADPLVGAACPKILLEPDDDADGFVINNAGSVLLSGGWAADRGLGEPDDGRYDTETDVFAWCGGGVVLRRDYLDDVGLFDERFFLYYEDIDLSWRGRTRGWRYRYVPAARMTHLHSASTVQGSVLFEHYVERNRLVMLAKNAPAPFALWAFLRYPLSTLGVVRRDVVGALAQGRRPDSSETTARVRAWFDALGLLPHALRQRRAIRRRQLVDDAEILAWQVPAS